MVFYEDDHLFVVKTVARHEGLIDAEGDFSAVTFPHSEKLK